MILVSKPGESLPKVEKRAEETITYSLDIEKILVPNEVAVSIKGVTSKLNIGKYRTRRGTSIELTVLPHDIGAPQYMDYTVSVLFETNMGNTRSAVFNIRVYK
jgi:hypothetical protein